MFKYSNFFVLFVKNACSKVTSDDLFERRNLISRIRFKIQAKCWSNPDIVVKFKRALSMTTKQQ